MIILLDLNISFTNLVDLLLDHIVSLQQYICCACHIYTFLIGIISSQSWNYIFLDFFVSTSYIFCAATNNIWTPFYFVHLHLLEIRILLLLAVQNIIIFIGISGLQTNFGAFAVKVRELFFFLCFS